MIEVRFHPRARGVSADFARRAVSAALRACRAKNRLISVYVTTDAEIRRINKKFLRHDFATDVLSFETGDIVVSADFARRYARAHAIPFREELARYLIHGTLHLLGYDDRKRSDREKMHRKQESILEKVMG